MNKKVFVIVVLMVIIVFVVMLGIFFKTKSENNKNIANSTTPYIPDGVNLANEKYIGIPVDTIELNRNKENVTIEVLPDTITEEKAEILITDNNKDHYGWGVEFRVQKKVNGEWKNLKYVSDRLTWNSIAYMLDENNQLTQKLDIKYYYGTLENGTYRIVKPVYDNGYIDIYSNEFEIK